MLNGKTEVPWNADRPMIYLTKATISSHTQLTSPDDFTILSCYDGYRTHPGDIGENVGQEHEERQVALPAETSFSR